jgi:hypothetical protein
VNWRFEARGIEADVRMLRLVNEIMALDSKINCHIKPHGYIAVFAIAVAIQ